MEITVLFISLASMGGIGVFLALILVVADKKFAVIIKDGKIYKNTAK